MSSSLFIKLQERIELALKSEFGIKLIEHVKLTMSSRINQQILKYVKDIYYGSSFVENKLDIYMPDNTVGSTFYGSTTTFYPVIIFFYGGGWAVGSKNIHQFLGMRLSQMGYVVVIPDYTKYPKTNIDGIISDFKRAVVWTKKSINEYGGDPNNIYLMGHSAGAHTSIFTIIRDVIYKSRNDEGKTNTELYDIDPEWNLPKISGLILMSGCYDMPKHYEFEVSIGFEDLSSMSRVMGNTQESLVKNSPLLLIQDIANNKLININQVKNLMPKKIFIIHGDQDLPIKELKFKIYQDKGHDEIVYDMMNLSNPELVADFKEFMSV
ncbi:7066_t:CDS:10 [Diversispora eburnea]|uniref:7066_t:CDS:1 n=1 Tax=Diversispora eburnea TaxID=1213867 RepID=A0A9N8V041_9GLOM|nr:7066_t:CDS:10 [Diversispora eburnea]